MTVYGTTTVYDDLSEWIDACLDVGYWCRRMPEYAHKDGYLTYHGAPDAFADYDDNLGWHFYLKKTFANNKPTMLGKSKIWYNCTSWQGAYGAKNVSGMIVCFPVSFVQYCR